MKYLLKAFCFLMLAMMLAKVAFMLVNCEGQDFSFADIIDVLRHGLSLDLSTTLYFLLLPYLAVVVVAVTRCFNPQRTKAAWHQLLRFLLKPYYFLAALVLSVAFTVDTSLYPFWGFKLDASVLQFLDTTGDALTSVSTGYVLLRIFVILLLTFIFYCGWLLITPKNDVLSHHQTKRKNGWTTLLLLLAGIPIMVIGMRGGIGVSTANVGQVYYSSRQFLNHSAVNPVFSFLASLGKSSDDVPQFDFLDDTQLFRTLDGVFFTTSEGADTLMQTQRPDILLIIMESCGSAFTSLAGRGDVTPNLTRLAAEGISFTQCYCNSWRTDRGMVSILSGWPAFPNVSVMKMPAKTATMPGLAMTLKREGYTSTFLYGGDANFTNTRGYLLTTGFDQIISEDDFTASQRGTSKWGVCDSIVFDRLYSLVTKKTDSEKKAFNVMLTLSSHEPWTVPMPTRFSDEVLNAFFYMDLQLGRFIERFRQTPQWQNTLVIILPDHGIKYENYDETHPLRAHIPMIWTGGAIRRASQDAAPHVVDRFCCQSDLAATLLGQMGIAHNDYPYSRDILCSEYRHPLAFHNWPEGFSVVDSSGFHVFDLNTRKVIVGSDDSAIQTGKAILQTTSRDLKER